MRAVDGALLFAVGAMLLCYALEARGPVWTLAFADACALGSVYGFLQGAWPFGLIEAIWSLVAMRKWRLRRREGAEGLSSWIEPLTAVA